MVSATFPIEAPVNESLPVPQSIQRNRDDVLRLGRMLSDGNRVEILTQLCDRNELNVTELCTHLGQSQPAVSHHLKLLRLSGLVSMRRDGKHNFYSLNESERGSLQRILLDEV